MSDTNNPPNPYHEAKFEAWSRYTEAYHSNAPEHIQARLFKAYEVACEDFRNNPQTIFN